MTASPGSANDFGSIVGLYSSDWALLISPLSCNPKLLSQFSEGFILQNIVLGRSQKYVDRLQTFG